MRRKHVQLVLTRHAKEIRHWLAVVLGITLLCFAFVSIGNQNRLLKKVSNANKQIVALAEENKQLNTQSKQIAKQNQTYARQAAAASRCAVMVISVYTHNFVPINVKDYDTCTLTTSGRTVSSNASTSNKTPSASATVSHKSSSPSTKSTSGTPPPQSNNPPSNPVKRATTFVNNLVNGILKAL